MFEGNYSSYTDRSREDIYSSSGGAREKGKRVMKLSLPSKMVEQLVWVPVISFCKISFLVTHLMSNYAKTGHSRPLIARLY
jgi:hypothetical protein